MQATLVAKALVSGFIKLILTEKLSTLVIVDN